MNRFYELAVYIEAHINVIATKSGISNIRSVWRVFAVRGF